MEREWRLGGATSVCHHLVKPLLSLLAAVAVPSHKVVRVGETRSTAATLLNREQLHKHCVRPHSPKLVQVSKKIVETVGNCHQSCMIHSDDPLFCKVI